MNLVISTILIPLLLVSQSLFCFAHSHTGTSVAEPKGHAARPHVHLHHDHDHQHHGHHEDGDKTPPSPVQHVPGHDSNAVYAGNIQLLHDGKVARVAAMAELAASDVVSGDTSATIVLWRLCTQLSSPPMLRPKCARYVQFHAILC